MLICRQVYEALLLLGKERWPVLLICILLVVWEPGRIGRGNMRERMRAWSQFVHLSSWVAHFHERFHLVRSHQCWPEDQWGH